MLELLRAISELRHAVVATGGYAHVHWKLDHPAWKTVTGLIKEEMCTDWSRVKICFHQAVKGAESTLTTHIF